MAVRKLVASGLATGSHPEAGADVAARGALMLAGNLAGFANLAVPRFGAVPTPSEA